MAQATPIALREIEPRGSGWLILFAAFAAVAAIGGGAAIYMEEHGHIVTGMDNQIVWGLPHVFAVFLIVAASGALNVASMGSVFGRKAYKPLAPLSGLLALALLLGGLTILMLDLGRPDRLIVAMTHYNFKSIFALNIFLYTGFMAIVAAYLWTMLDRSVERFKGAAGLAAFVWRVALTTGTGSIFGFIVARQGFDSALIAPMFVALSLSYGTALFLIVLAALDAGTERKLGEGLRARLARLQAILIATGLYFVVVHHLTNLYFTKHHGWERFVLEDGGAYTGLFWIGQVALGGLLPLYLLLSPANAGKPKPTLIAAVATVLGAFAQMAVTIIGGQAWPEILFPGYEVHSSFGDGQIAHYAASLPEALLGFGGVAVAALIVLVAIRVLPLVPERLDDPSYAQD